MGNFNSIIGNLAKNAPEQESQADYKNEHGLFMCGICNQQKECVLEFPPDSGNYRSFPCSCKCVVDEEKAYKDKMRKQKQEEYIKQLRKRGITDIAYLSQTFENDDGRNLDLKEKCKRYVDNWQIMKELNTGILFYGDTGTGKSFYACCIANALIQQSVSVLVTNLSKLVRDRTDNNGQRVSITSPDLLVLDDLGVENATSTAYNIIDERYRCGKPIIITTNLLPSELKAPDSLEKKRIYDRVLERCCCTMHVKSSVTRLSMAQKQKTRAEKILEGK